jgi:hypothetical protein
MLFDQPPDCDTVGQGCGCGFARQYAQRIQDHGDVNRFLQQCAGYGWQVAKRSSDHRHS